MHNNKRVFGKLYYETQIIVTKDIIISWRNTMLNFILLILNENSVVVLDGEKLKEVVFKND